MFMHPMTTMKWLALTKGNLISHDPLYLQEKFGFSEENM